jgi:hypothetical protein
MATNLKLLPILFISDASAAAASQMRNLLMYPQYTIYLDSFGGMRKHTFNLLIFIIKRCIFIKIKPFPSPGHAFYWTLSSLNKKYKIHSGFLL